MTAAQKKAFVARMQKARKGSKNPAKRKSAKSSGARKNPQPSRRHNHSRRNPNKLTQYGMNVLSALLSAVATRQLPQLLLGANNASWLGYGANSITAALATFFAHQFVSADAAQAAAIGGGVIVLDRVLTEQVSPIGQYLSLTGLGDATAATSLGQISDGYYIHPTIFDSNGKPIIPHEITDAAVAAFLALQPAPAGKGQQRQLPAGSMSGTGTDNRFKSRFN